MQTNFSHQTLEQYRSAVLDILDKKGFQMIFDTVSELTGVLPTNLTAITAKVIDQAFYMNLPPEGTAEVLYDAAIFSYQEIFGSADKQIKH